MSQKIGPREQALRDQREARFKAEEIARKTSTDSLREKIAAVPARKPKAAKKKRQ
ncbi:MAG TPA: hypothetical protein VIU44_07770 [Gaiellaceae bacterium]